MCCLPTAKECELVNGVLVNCGRKCSFCSRPPRSICIRKKDTDKCLVDKDVVFDTDPDDPLPIAPLYPNTTDTTFECVTKNAEPKPTSINWYIEGEYLLHYKCFIVPTLSCSIPKILTTYLRDHPFQISAIFHDF